MNQPQYIIAAPAQTQAKPDAIDGLKKAGIYAGIGLGVYIGGKYLYRKYRQNLLNDKMQTNENARFAAGIENALHSGWFGIAIDQKALFDIASRIKDYNAVSDFYADLTGDNLTSVLTTKLSTDDYKTFMDLLQTKGTTPGNTIVSTTPTTNAGMLAIATKPVMIRKNPVILNSPVIDFFANQIKEVPANTVIGNATGLEFYFDAAWYQFLTDNVWFSELLVHSSDGTKQIVYAWKGAIQFVSPTVYVNQNGSYNPYVFDAGALNGINQNRFSI